MWQRGILEPAVTELRPSHYKDALEYFKESGTRYNDDVPNPPPAEVKDFQKKE